MCVGRDPGRHRNTAGETQCIFARRYSRASQKRCAVPLKGFPTYARPDSSYYGHRRSLRYSHMIDNIRRNRVR
jgi:hypothetical protein